MEVLWCSRGVCRFRVSGPAWVVRPRPPRSAFVPLRVGALRYVRLAGGTAEAEVEKGAVVKVLEKRIPEYFLVENNGLTPLTTLKAKVPGLGWGKYLMTPDGRRLGAEIWTGTGSVLVVL